MVVYASMFIELERFTLEVLPNDKKHMEGFENVIA